MTTTSLMVEITWACYPDKEKSKWKEVLKHPEATEDDESLADSHMQYHLYLVVRNL